MPKGVYVHKSKHGHAPAGQKWSRTYGSWVNMKSRCIYPNHQSFDYCGGRGIMVCARWEKFENFLADMGERPPGKTLDRIENSGNYEPGNCRWATRGEQDRNKRQAVWITIKGETLCATDWAAKVGLKPATVLARIYTMHWNPIDAVMKPLRLNQWAEGKRRIV